MFILKIKEKHKMPQSVINTMIESITTLFQLHLKHIGDIVTQHLKKSSVDDHIIELISAIFSSDGEHIRLFKGLETEYQQQKFFKKLKKKFLKN